MFALWLIYMGYLTLRRMVESPAQRAKLSAVFGVVGAVDSVIVYMANRWWRTQHPQPVIAGGEGSGLNPMMWGVFLTAWGALLGVMVLLLRQRYRLEALRYEIEALQWETDARAAEREASAAKA